MVEIRALRKIYCVTLADRARNSEVRENLGLKESVSVRGHAQLVRISRNNIRCMIKKKVIQRLMYNDKNG